ncbi:MAG: hypothetical protein EOP49_21595 [Sphingobacteriales bacterium]|nr:MAG: hypothetical protein EOP49_21595 [Sphingobacteriales bacterium]
MGFPPGRIVRVERLIHATHNHIAADGDGSHFLDADLAILGAAPDDYWHYADNIRKEYSMYADTVYNEGRRKVLMSFLTRERIYISNFFHHEFEAAARKNLQRELEDIR